MTDLLSIKDCEFCRKKVNSYNQLACGVMLAYFKQNAKFPNSKEEIPSNQFVSLIALELEVKDVGFTFNWESKTAERYRCDIRKYLGYRMPRDSDSSAFKDYLIADILLDNPSNELLLEKIRLFLHQNKIESFKPKNLQRYISSAQNLFEKQLFQKIVAVLDKGTLAMIDAVLVCDDESKSEIISLSELRLDIAGAKLKNITHALDKIRFLRKFGINQEVMKGVHRKLLLKYSNRIMALHPSNILEFGETAKYATMSIFIYIRLQLMLDSLCDTFVKLIKKMRRSAEKHVDTYIVNEVKRVDGKFDILEKMASVSVNHPKGIIEDKIYSEVPKATLEELITDRKSVV